MNQLKTDTAVTRHGISERLDLTVGTFKTISVSHTCMTSPHNTKPRSKALPAFN